MVLGFKNYLSTFHPYNSERESTLIVGKTGKSTALERFALDDYFQKKHFVFLGNGKNLISHFRKNPKSQFFNFQTSFPFNFLKSVPPHLHSTLASSLTTALMKKGMTPFRQYTFQTYFRIGVLTLLQLPGANILWMKKLYTDSAYRTECLGHITDPVLKDFWNDFDQLPEREQRQNIESTLVVLYDMLLEPRLRRCLFQRGNHMSFKHVTIVDLDEAEFGRDIVTLLGSLVLSNLVSSGVSTTVYIDDADRFPFVDELLLNPRITTIYAMRSVEKVPPVRVIAFRTSKKEADLLDFDLKPDDYRLHELPRHQAYVREGERITQLYMDVHHYPITNYKPKYSQTSDEYTDERIRGFFWT